MEIKKLPKSKFPKALLEIPQPPEKLYILGDFAQFWKYSRSTIYGVDSISRLKKFENRF